ncbi:hypothetical protein K466DRAFT_557345 [Polyporus arcularius HHB13444]|uniref:RING-type domain-containing protein n=1 Tax=Polyporus arcularius HHB13444 TaxID=1314778 RepID=A0A5C3NZV6_9APHY|nr:hypothetical protein K466DRAFT_557345 [Polyporus arcularius HHB13444]
MDALTCGICLDNLRVPVCTPCGHLCCEACLTSYIEASADALNASCPTCRSPFPITNPDLRFVAKKYHSFIIPSIRRVFLPTDDDAPEQAGPSQTRRDLVAQIATLNEKVAALVRDKSLLMDRCEAAFRASHAHAQHERDERLEKERLVREMRELRKKYDCVKSKYKTLKASQENAAPAPPQPAMIPSMKRKSTSSPGVEPADDAPASHSQRRISKRPRLVLGSPFDLSKRIQTRSQTGASGPRKVLIDEDEDELHDSDFEPAFNVSSSSSTGPQHSGLPMGDIFSPERSVSQASRGNTSRGSGHMNFAFEGPRAVARMRTLGGGLRPVWMLSPEETNV